MKQRDWSRVPTFRRTTFQPARWGGGKRWSSHGLRWRQRSMTRRRSREHDQAERCDQQVQTTQKKINGELDLLSSPHNCQGAVRPHRIVGDQHMRGIIPGLPKMVWFLPPGSVWSHLHAEVSRTTRMRPETFHIEYNNVRVYPSQVIPMQQDLEVVIVKQHSRGRSRSMARPERRGEAARGSAEHPREPAPEPPPKARPKEPVPGTPPKAKPAPKAKPRPTRGGQMVEVPDVEEKGVQTDPMLPDGPEYFNVRIPAMPEPILIDSIDRRSWRCMRMCRK